MDLRKLIANYPMVRVKIEEEDKTDFIKLLMDLGFLDASVINDVILYPDGSPYITMECGEFPNFGIWSKPGAPFVCLEPWLGRADNVGFEGEICDKPGITAVNSGDEFEISHKIIVG